MREYAWHIPRKEKERREFMKKRKGRIISLLVAVVILVSSCVVGRESASASSYPLVFQQGYPVQACYKGDVLMLGYDIFPEYINERMKVRVYNSRGVCVAKADRNFYNTSAAYFTYTVRWDTSTYSLGTYTVVATTYYYSYGSWHAVPYPERTKVTINRKPSNGVSIKSITEKNHKVIVNYKPVYRAKKYMIKVGSSVGTTTKTKYISRTMPRLKWTNVYVRAYVNGKWGPWTPVHKVWIPS